MALVQMFQVQRENSQTFVTQMELIKILKDLNTHEVITITRLK